jgi:hypothetical protein
VAARFAAEGDAGTQLQGSRRLAIRAAKFEPEADCAAWTASEIHCDGISEVEKNEGPLRANKDSLAFPIVPFQCLNVPQHSF